MISLGNDEFSAAHIYAFYSPITMLCIDVWVSYPIEHPCGAVGPSKPLKMVFLASIGLNMLSPPLIVGQVD